MHKLNFNQHDDHQAAPIGHVAVRIPDCALSGASARGLWSVSSTSALVTTGRMPHPWTVTWVRAEPRSLRSVLANAEHDAALRDTWRRRSNCRTPSFRTRRRALPAIADRA